MGDFKRGARAYGQGDFLQRRGDVGRSGVGRTAGSDSGPEVGVDLAGRADSGALRGSLALAQRNSPVAVTPGEHLPFSEVLGRAPAAWHGAGAAGIGYSVLATFVTLYDISRHWNPNGAALCLSAFGLAFITARLLFIEAVNRFGDFL